MDAPVFNSYEEMLFSLRQHFYVARVDFNAIYILDRLYRYGKEQVNARNNFYDNRVNSLMGNIGAEEPLIVGNITSRYARTVALSTNRVISDNRIGPGHLPRGLLDNIFEYYQPRVDMADYRSKLGLFDMESPHVRKYWFNLPPYDWNEAFKAAQDNVSAEVQTLATRRTAENDMLRLALITVKDQMAGVYGRIAEDKVQAEQFVENQIRWHETAGIDLFEVSIDVDDVAQAWEGAAQMLAETPVPSYPYT